MSETRAHPNINVSITNNFINSSVNYSSRGRSSKNIHSKLYEMSKSKDRHRKSLETRVNQETGVSFTPRINKSKPSYRCKYKNSLATIKSEGELCKKKFNFRPKINNKSKKLANKHRNKRNIPRPKRQNPK